MTVVIYRLQQHGRRGQRIDTRHPGRQSQNLRSRFGEVKLIAFFFLARQFDGFNSLSLLVESTRGEGKFLLGFGFIVSLL